MHLWTEYEGNTLAGYPVGRLSRSEGRSAFFLTSDEDKPALLRLTESHFDEGELIQRWEKIAAVSHPGLQALRRSGQTTFDGVPLAFCVLEPNDASLSDVLRERVLSTVEAAEVAEAVAGGLSALHRAGLVHGHVDAINVFAMGEAVKLRSDCVRECTGDFEADTEDAREALRQRDVHDLGLLLRRCLTPQWEESTAMQLPSPFDRIVRRALNGTVDAAGIVAEMELLQPAKPAEAIKPAPVTAAPAVPAPGAVPVQPATRTGTAIRSAGAVSTPGPQLRPAFAAGRRAGSMPPRVHVTGENSPAAISAMLADRDVRSGNVAASGAGTGEAEPIRFSPRRPAGVASRPDGEAPGYGALNVRLDRMRNRLRHNTGMASRGGVLELLSVIRGELVRRKVWVASGIAAAVVGLVLWNTTSGAHGASQPASPTPRATASVSGGAPGQAASLIPAGQTASVASHPQPAQTSLFASGAQAGWHVIAYTYRYEKQAQAKAMELKERYTGMEPQVYSPNGRAPYFVALGGPSDSVSAMALRNRARRAGLPRDTYARNF